MIKVTRRPQIFMTFSFTDVYVYYFILPREGTLFQGVHAFRWRVGLC